MLDSLKKAAMQHAMKLLSHPWVGRILSDPRTGRLMSKAFECQARLQEHIKPLLSLVEAFLPGKRQKDSSGT
ncbi:MAG: hypothetical protein GYA21_01250 [Myxococcales bacterium]|nr:hypothetical protein [Myxococcales bacterium]